MASKPRAFTLNDRQSNTLNVIQSTNDYIFGGYTSVAWDSSRWSKHDPTTFLFSLVNARSLPLLIPIKSNATQAIQNHPARGPSFGDGDIISDQSHANLNSFSFAGNCYKLGKERRSENFQTKEIEVFSLSYK